jgi:hypothetical protein
MAASLKGVQSCGTRELCQNALAQCVTNLKYCILLDLVLHETVFSQMVYEVLYIIAAQNSLILCCIYYILCFSSPRCCIIDADIHGRYLIAIKLDAIKLYVHSISNILYNIYIYIYIYVHERIVTHGMEMNPLKVNSCLFNGRHSRLMLPKEGKVVPVHAKTMLKIKFLRKK